ncbi:hypothetical protein F2981_21825 (plasmid) [Sinorhizobium meliloti]|nr:hypothetical protein [Sinorhizobium meliloti]
MLTRERLLEILGTALQAAEDSWSPSARWPAPPRVRETMSRTLLVTVRPRRIPELYERPLSNAFRKLVVMEGFEDMTAREIPG